jgi:hypothetical protein
MINMVDLVCGILFIISGLLGLSLIILLNNDIQEKVWIRNKQVIDKRLYLEKYKLSVLPLSIYALVAGII